jgi:tetratricopeptide (TPR) repeat protein
VGLLYLQVQNDLDSALKHF